MPWIAGQQLQGGKYVIEEVLGKGGFGTTYKALEVDLERTVVIKTLREDRSDELDIKQFKEEAKTLAGLSQKLHRHIVTVFTWFQEGDIYCLVMEFVSGENLFKVVERRGALPETEIVPLIRQIGEALIVVHKAGVVHRDAHPGNIMLLSNDKGNYDQAVLIDFGIAKKVVPSTQSSINKHGHKNFVPYEQIYNGSRHPTVDVYCLAATLYYAVTGQPPTNSLDRRLGNASLIPPKQDNQAISKRLNQAILKGMALEPEHRPQSMQEWLAMLEAPKTVPPPSVEQVYRKETVHSQNKLNSEANIGKQITKSPRIIPWRCLIGVLVSNLLIANHLVVSNASSWVWALAVVMVWAVATATCVAFAVAVVGILALALRWSPVAGLWVVVVAVLVGMAREKLEKSFSEFHTFFILVVTSFFGLGLGWLGHLLFNTRP